MKQVLIKSGSVIVENVPSPVVGHKHLLVKVLHSCISVGTEISGMKLSGLPLYQRALKQPENVKRVMDMAREQGLRRTIDRVSGKLSSGSPTGYSASGVVLEIGEEVTGFSVGDLVACAGAGIANHAEIINVPVNLAVRIPNNVSTKQASTVTLGAIALQGVRRAQPTLGEVFVIIGLGVLGQITAQILSANGCKVVGVDIDDDRIELAKTNGISYGINSKNNSCVEEIIKLTSGVGADGVIITAAASSNEIISMAMQVCRRKARVVLVGDVGTNLKRSDFYHKELDFLISTSYGPGRYDPFYEEEGNDYPIGYVRWTENRNMQAYLDLIATDKIQIEKLIDETFCIDDAKRAYDALNNSSDTKKPLITLLEYSKGNNSQSTRVKLNISSQKPGVIRLSLIGGSSFAQSVHLPNIIKLRDKIVLHGVVSRTGANAHAIAKQYNAEYCSTKFEDVLADEKTDLVLIATRHDLHGQMVLEGLRAGKHVFVEKPLTIKPDDIRLIEDFYEQNHDAPMLMVGFNRRFSPIIKEIKNNLIQRNSPVIINYTMNAGFIERDHWVHGPEGGGRNIGEACHIYDLFNYLVGSSEVEAITAMSINPQSPIHLKNDNFVATIKYSDGSLCTLTYTALGHRSYPKEKMEVFVNGNVITMENYLSASINGGNKNLWSSKTINKGQFEEIAELVKTINNGTAWPISLKDIISATRTSFIVNEQILSQKIIS